MLRRWRCERGHTSPNTDLHRDELVGQRTCLLSFDENDFTALGSHIIIEGVHLTSGSPKTLLFLDVMNVPIPSRALASSIADSALSRPDQDSCQYIFSVATLSI